MLTLIPIETLQLLVSVANAAAEELYDGLKDGTYDDAALAGYPSKEVDVAIIVGQTAVDKPTRPIVVANITGGVLQGASANVNVDVYCLDFDERGHKVDGSLCQIYEEGSLVDPDFVAQVLGALGDADPD